MSNQRENKVRFNLKNVHYAVMQTAEDGKVTWGTPVHVPGAVSLSLDPQGDVSKFYADGMVYYRAIANNGYSGDLEMARFPDAMLADVWGVEVVPGDNVAVENANVEPKPFALLYQIDGDVDARFYVMYNCTGTRPAIGSQTTTETKEPQTQSTTISADPMANGDVMASTRRDTTEAVKAAWFTKVYEKPTQAEEEA